MCIFYLIGLGLGSLGVFQTIVNSRIGNQCGLTLMALINSFAGLIFTAFYALIVFWRPNLFPQMFRIQTEIIIKWWYFSPAFLGILALMLGPLTLTKIGAFPSVIAMLVGQIFTAFLWNSFVEHQSITLAKIMGLLLTGAGAYFSFKN